MVIDVSLSPRLLIFRGVWLICWNSKISITFVRSSLYGLLLFDEPKEGEDWSAVFDILHVLVCVRGSVQEAICSNICGV